MNSSEELNYYLIPGMGANRRLYENYQLPGMIHHLEWEHVSGPQTLADYAKHLAKKMNTSNNIIVGSSMGGMMAVELSRIVRPLLTVLISAPTGRHQFPRSLKILDRIGLHRAMGPKTLFKLTKLCDTFMGFKTEEQRSMFYEMMQSNGPDFLHYSVKAVLGWNNLDLPEGSFIQIIGDRDRLFDCRKIPGSIVLKGSGHFSTYEKSEEICAIITAGSERFLRF
ncbi:MAG: alpha/beta hydrolase [Flavobacteriales bacterium]